jgi:heme oxygenase
MMLTPQHTVEDVLRLITDRAAFLKHFSESAAVNHNVAPDARAFSGLADACEELEEWARAIYHALDVAALGAQIGRNQHRRERGGRQS